ncbi:sensor histidine kinase [Bacteroidota bacterium]
MLITIAVPVYLNFYLLNIFFNKQKYLLYLISLISMVMIWGLLLHYLILFVINIQNNLSEYWLLSFIIIVISVAFKYARIGYMQRIEFQELKSVQLQTELSFLKAQMNPHFLFNTLNNLYGLSKRRDKGTADGIAQLSHLMRYIIYESNVDKILLKKEIEQIKRLIELQKLRFSEDDDITINLNIDGDPEKTQIPPLILLPFVENAFKHGISLVKNSFIKINLRISETSIKFSVLNSIPVRMKPMEEPDSGLGLKNVKRRLDLLYPDLHELIIESDNSTFSINLLLQN